MILYRLSSATSCFILRLFYTKWRKYRSSDTPMPTYYFFQT